MLIGGEGGYIITRPIDPTIIENKDVINEIRKLFPVDDKGEGIFYMYELTDDKNSGIRIHITAKYFWLRSSEFKRSMSFPATNHSGLSKEDVIQFWNIIPFLEEYGWEFDKKEDWIALARPGDQIVASYDYPLPENRALFIELLKKVYTVPMTKRALS